MKKQILFLVVLLSAMALTTWLRAPRWVRTEDNRTKLGSYAQIVLVTQPGRDVSSVMEECYKEIDHWNLVFSRYVDSTELSAINHRSQASVMLSQDLWAVWQDSYHWYTRTQGAFDPSVLPLITLWKNCADKNVMPTQEELAGALAKVGLNKVKQNPDKRELVLPEGMQLDFGGIAKGYIIQKVADTIRARGIENALVDIGGDLIALGHNEKGKRWRIAVEHPINPKKPLAKFSLSNEAMVTSGDYYRFFVIEGQTFSHIIDPHTGRPVQGHYSVTLRGPDVVALDALATALCTWPVKKAKAFLKTEPGLQGLFYIPGKD